MRLLGSRSDGLAAALNVLDSGGANPAGIGDYERFTRAQVAWHRETARGFETWVRLDDGTLAERPIHEPDSCGAPPASP